MGTDSHAIQADQPMLVGDIVELHALQPTHASGLLDASARNKKGLPGMSASCPMPESAIPCVLVLSILSDPK